MTHMLVGKYFYTHDSHLLDFDMDDVVLFDKKYFFPILWDVQHQQHNLIWWGFFFFFRKFQPMTFAPDHNSLSSDQDTNQFLVYAKIEPQISYTTIRDFTS